MMNWKKAGRIIAPQHEFKWMRTHAMVPTADAVSGDLFRIYFSGRDAENRSRIGYALIDLNDPHNVLEWSREPVLDLGELGCFDDNGVTPSWIVTHDGQKFLYYIGWRPRSTTRMSVVAGLAVSEDNGATFRRVSRAPILRLTDKEPLSVLTAPCVLKERDLWRMWYVSGVDWLQPDLPRYNVKYAESTDGIAWEQYGIVCIDANSSEETALARPCVLRDNGKYRMWFSTKSNDRSYRIGYAESKDGLDWSRQDDQVGLDVSDSGWDSEMIEYAFVFKHKVSYYMLYNGNNYGSTGIGLAVSV